MRTPVGVAALTCAMLLGCGGVAATAGAPEPAVAVDAVWQRRAHYEAGVVIDVPWDWTIDETVAGAVALPPAGDTATPLRAVFVTRGETFDEVCERLGLEAVARAAEVPWRGRLLTGARIRASAQFLGREVAVDGVRVGGEDERTTAEEVFVSTGDWSWVLVIDARTDRLFADEVLARVKRAPETSGAPALGRADRRYYDDY